MKSSYILWALILCPGITLSIEFGGMFETEDLYKKGVDIGITSLEKSEVNETLQKTKKPWLIQFYSSWCGHCQRFAPTYKEFGIRVQGWTDVMGFGAINCAQDYNTQACRDFDITGYPSLKLFAPNQPVSNLGELIRAHDVQAIMNEATNWIEGLERNDTTKLLSFAPDLTYLQSSNPIDIWKTKNEKLQDADTAILIFSNDTSNAMVNSLILDFYHLTKSSSKPILIRKVSTNQKTKLNEDNSDSSITTANQLARNIGLKNDKALPFIVVLQRPNEVPGRKSLAEKYFKPEVLKRTMDGDAKFEDFLTTLINYSKGLQTALKSNEGSIVAPEDRSPSSDEKGGVIVAPKIKPVEDQAMIKRRRYTVYLSDLENALLYSLSHEVAQKKSIIGKSFDAFQHYLEVLIQLFPTKGRNQTLLFLQALYKWTNAHEDGILGEDLSAKIIELRLKFKCFSDVTDYIGCKGSISRYGNYPCALWSLWHVLTVQQSEQQVVKDPAFVLTTMVEYVEQFFGCRDCAENFLKEAEHGVAVRREVKTTQDSILWLWKTHNKANLRLKGDLQTDDPAYPKSVFPEEKFCPQCFITKNTYEEESNTWSVDKKEYNVMKTLKFLKDLYSDIKMSNLTISDEAHADVRNINPRFSLKKNQVAVIYSDPIQGKEGQMLNSKGDVSLMFLVYGVSIILFVLVLIKVIYRRNGRCLLTFLYPCQKYFISNSISPSKSRTYDNKFVV